MPQTLLEITQDILSIMDGDEVNSIFDTEESEQVAKIVRRTYNAMVSNSNWLHTRKGLVLISSGDSSKPTHISLPADVKQLETINYDVRKEFTYRKEFRNLKWKEPDDFLRYTNHRNSNDTNVLTVEDYSGIEVLILTNKSPEYYTTFDDSNIILDSYDSSLEATIQQNKIQAYGFIIPVLEFVDSAVANLPPDAWSAFVEEATSKAQWQVRQLEDPKSEQEARRQNRWLARKQWRVEGGIKYRDYGKKR